MSEENPDPDETPKTSSDVIEVRYSLREMMREVEEEQMESSMGREIIDQSTIETILKKKSKKGVR
ncbi:hypothetical protein [Rubellicoccus peritrichatus]|uniref:Uncharacterized protein n=1 Tax=Rubellicoccus peritrichatus TaxID=3080537 RepID=A0AAQ3LFK4_9BACT|nr:hypothetical protein [Puniceicoccus sp. CR14]WOO42853.1 hypothetical protein RZN69_07090 [Puniceicoccus sp. CR14]